MTLIGAADHHLDCPAGQYYSVIITRAGTDINLAQNRFTMAVNDPLSQSGWAAPCGMGITGDRQIITDSHHESALSVSQGRADVAAIDVVTWHHICQQIDTTKLDVITQSPPNPALPFITAKTRDPEPIFQALSHAIHDIGTQDQNCLRLYDLIPVRDDSYLSLSIPPLSIPLSPQMI